MAKLVDALPSGGSVRKDVQVRILFWAQNKKRSPCKCCIAGAFPFSAQNINIDSLCIGHYYVYYQRRNKFKIYALIVGDPIC